MLSHVIDYFLEVTGFFRIHSVSTGWFTPSPSGLTVLSFFAFLFPLVLPPLRLQAVNHYCCQPGHYLHPASPIYNAAKLVRIMPITGCRPLSLAVTLSATRGLPLICRVHACTDFPEVSVLPRTQLHVVEQRRPWHC